MVNFHCKEKTETPNGADDNNKSDISPYFPLLLSSRGVVFFVQLFLWEPVLNLIDEFEAMARHDHLLAIEPSVPLSTQDRTSGPGAGLAQGRAVRG